MSRRRRPLWSRVRARLRQLVAFLFSNVGVVLLVTGYTITGAFMFQGIESGTELAQEAHMRTERNNTISYLWYNVTLALNPYNETEVKFRISEVLSVYQRSVVVSARRGWDGERGTKTWTFPSAFLYSLTVITTIGYGNLSPRTSLGKVVTIFYALLGMPLFLLYLTNVGELFARWFKCIYALVCLCRGCPGFNRRKVARLKTQELQEVSEVESIERPEHWTSQDQVYNLYEITNHKANRSKTQSNPQISNFYHPEYRSARRSLNVPYPMYQDTINPRRFNCYQNYPDSHGRGKRDFDATSVRRQDHNRRNYQDFRILENVDVRGFKHISNDGVSQESSEFTYVTFDAQTITVPISVCVTIMVGYIMFGSMLFGFWEKWNTLDGAYFCFISLTSIGFGDFVPGERVFTPKIEPSFILCSLYLMLGMALIAMCFNLMQEQVIHYFAGMKRAFRRICRCSR